MSQESAESGLPAPHLDGDLVLNPGWYNSRPFGQLAREIYSAAAGTFEINDCSIRRLGERDSLDCHNLWRFTPAHAQTF